MTTKTDLGTVKLLEIPDSLKLRNRTKEEGRELTTGYRLVMSFSSNELSDKEKDLLAKVPEATREKVKEKMLANRTEVRYSGVFNAEDIVKTKDGKPFKTPENGLSNEQQDRLLDIIKEEYKAMDNVNIFTVITFTILELLDDTDYKGTQFLLYTDENNAVTKIQDQSRLFFGFFDDTDAAKSMMRRSLLRRIDDGDLELPAKTTKQETAKGDAPKQEKQTDDFDFLHLLTKQHLPYASAVWLLDSIFSY